VKRKEFFGLVLTVSVLSAAVLSAGGCKRQTSVSTPAAAEEEQPVIIRLAVQPGDVQPYVADELGYFKEEGLTVELPVFSYGPPIIEAFTSKSVDLGLVGDLPAYAGIANGIDLEIIGIYMTSSSLHALVVRDAAKITRLEDLKGKKVSVPFGSNAQPLVYLYLERGGLKETDLEVINLGVADGAASIVAGNIDATVIWEPQVSVATQPGNGVSKLLTAEGFKLFTNPIIARNEFITRYPKQTAAFLRAFNKAGIWAKAHHDEAAEILYRRSNVDPKIVKIILSNTDRTANLTPERIQALIDGAAQAYQYGLIVEKIDVAPHIHTSYLEAAGIQ
jgi:aliphatic sulfonates family ABC transporter substrate-binding protein